MEGGGNRSLKDGPASCAPVNPNKEENWRTGPDEDGGQQKIS